MGLTLLKELTLEERISNAQVTLMNHDRYIAMAGVILLVEVTVKDDVPTAYTNGRDVVIGVRAESYNKRDIDTNCAGFGEWCIDNGWLVDNKWRKE